MNFRPHALTPETLVGRLAGGVEVKAVMHPLHGVALLGYYVGPRSAVEFEERIPGDASLSEVTQAIVRIYEQIGASDPQWKALHMRE